MRHPQLRTIVLIDPDLMDVLVYRRDAAGEWQDERFTQAEQRVAIDGTSASLSLSDIYEGVALPSGSAPPGEARA